MQLCFPLHLCQALAWSFLFCFGFMTLWAMLMVEFVHPLILQMHEQGRAFQEGLAGAQHGYALVRASGL